MFINLIKLFAELTYRTVKRRETQLGYKLVLNSNSNWIDGTMIYDMTTIWKRAGHNAIGVNYFKMGAVKNGKSTRFDPESLYFQS